MFEKIKKIFTNKDKKIENLISFLIILVITLIIINKILKKDTNETKDYENQTGVELATEETLSTNSESDSLETKLEEILSKIEGVGKVSVLITYSESSTVVPIYNVSLSTSTIEETDVSGGKRTTATQNDEKAVVTDESSNIITEKVIQPVIEGAIVTAEGANNPTIKSNIIMAVEAVTGLANHKIQVFEMGDE